MQHLGLLSILILTGGLIYLVRRWEGEFSETFSQIAARNRSSYFYYIALFGVSLPILYVFFAQWFAPHYGLTSAFVFIAGLSMAAQFVCTLFPDNGGWTSLEHRILTGISGVLLLPMVAILVFSSDVPLVGKLLGTVAFGLMLWLLVIALKNQTGHRYAMLLQIVYYALFFLPVLYLTYS